MTNWVSSAICQTVPETAERAWEQFLEQTSVYQLGSLFRRVLTRCPIGGRCLEIGLALSWGIPWLELRGVGAEGLDQNRRTVVRAEERSRLLGVAARIHHGNILDPRNYRSEYDVIYHHGILDHLTDEEARQLIAIHAAHARYVIFTVALAVEDIAECALWSRSRQDWETLLTDFPVQELIQLDRPGDSGSVKMQVEIKGNLASCADAPPSLDFDATILQVIQEAYLGDLSRARQLCATLLSERPHHPTLAFWIATLDSLLASGITSGRINLLEWLTPVRAVETQPGGWLRPVHSGQTSLKITFDRSSRTDLPDLRERLAG